MNWFSLPPCGSWEENSGREAWSQAPLPDEPPHGPKMFSKQFSQSQACGVPSQSSSHVPLPLTLGSVLLYLETSLCISKPVEPWGWWGVGGVKDTPTSVPCIEKTIIIC